MKPKRYRALHITPGVVDYTDGDQRETVLIKKPALDKMNRSFLGKPVFNYAHRVVDIENAFDFTSEEKQEHAVGVISNVGYDLQSGYYFADMMIWDEETQDNIAGGYKVSNAYVPEVEQGGIYNNVPYNEEVTGGEYDHMAIVENPRYGDVKIFENSKGEKPMKFTLFSGKKKEEPPKKEEEKEMKLNSDSVIVAEDGSEIIISEMVEVYMNAEDEKKKEEKKMEEEKKPTLNMEDTVEIDGKQVSLKELYDNYCAKKNAEPPTDEPLDDVVDPDLKKNAADDEGKAKPNENFKRLKINANKGAEPEKIKINTTKSRIERGKRLYGSDPVQAQAQGGN